MTTTFFFFQNIDRSFEFRVRFNLTRFTKNHTAFDFILINTTKQQTNVITSFTLIQQFAEHFNTSYNRFLIFTQTEDFNFVTYMNDTSFDKTSSNSTTTSNREHVFNRHQERFINITRRQRNPSINSIHQLHNFIFPFFYAIQCTKSRTTDDRSIVTVEFVCSQQFAHFHVNEFQHFFVINHIALVHKNNKLRYVYLTSQQDVLTSLRHRTISSSNYNDSTVHLSSTSYHVLYVVGVTRTVYVSIVTVSSFILYV